MASTTRSRTRTSQFSSSAAATTTTGDGADNNNHHDSNNERLVAPADFDGPTKHRHCTDVLCFLLLIAMWVGMTVIGIYALSEGDYRLVLYPLDYDGNICGTDYAADMTDYPNLLYINVYTAGVCVKDCPDLTNWTQDGLTDIRTLITYNGTWQPSTGGAELPLDFLEMGDYSNSSDAISCEDETCFPNDSPEDSWTSQGINGGFGYAYYAATTYWSLWRCYLTSDAEARIEELVNANATEIEMINGVSTGVLGGVAGLDDVYEFWNRLFADLWTARAYILGFGFGASLVVSFGYIFLMRLPCVLTILVWGSILATIVLFFVAGYYAWNLATDWDNAEPQTVDDNTIHATSIAAVVLWAVGAVLALLGCCLRRAIQLAIICVKEAGKAVNSMSMILLVPVLQAAGLIAFMGVFTTYAVHLASLGEITTKEVPLDTFGGPSLAYRVYTFDDFIENCGWYFLFCLFWTANFIVAVGDMIVAVAVAKWFFTRNKMTVGSWTVFTSIYETLRYHLGTCAYGSLLLAVIQIIRSLIARAQRAAKDSNNKIATVILCCCQCCFCCLEKCLKFINKNAYIQTAIFSTSFCKSCRASFALIFRNAARIGAVAYVSGAVLIVGKLFISAFTTGIGYYIIVENLNDELYSVGGPVTVIFLISYWMSDFFLDVFDMGISTVLHCLIADEEMFDGDLGYSEQSLKQYVDKYGNDDGGNR